MKRTRRKGWKPNQVPFRLALVAVALAMAWPAVGVTASTALASRAPDTVLAVWPFSAAAKVEKANGDLQFSNGRTSIEGSRRLALEALMREPINVQAARSLAVASASQGQPAQERRLMYYAHSLSRRDLLTELWMIDDAAGRGQLDETLAHYDHALRTRSTSWPVLLPTLVEASSNPLIGQKVEAIARSRPPYWVALADYAIESGPPRAAAPILGALKLDPRKKDERELVERAIAKLVVSDMPSSAYDLYRQARNLPAGKVELLRDGDFDAADSFSAFEWQLTDEPDLSAVREARNGATGTALSLSAGGGRRGEVARQSLVLPQGSYVVSLIAGGASADGAGRPVVVVRCERAGAELARWVVPTMTAPGPTQFGFQVPAGCSAQRLAIEIASGFGAEQTTAWVDNIILRAGSLRTSGASQGTAKR